MTDRKYFNVSIPYDMIAQAYQDNESYNAYCFLLGPVYNSDLPAGFKIIDAVLDDGDLIIEYSNTSEFTPYFSIEDGFLYLTLREEI